MKRLSLSAADVRALLANHKTQHWLPIKPQPVLVPSQHHAGIWEWPHASTWTQDEGFQVSQASWVASIANPLSLVRFCPYGQVGELLWVAEPWAVEAGCDALPPKDVGPKVIWYAADGEPKPKTLGGTPGRWRLALHMPQRLSRVVLELTEVRVTRMSSLGQLDAYNAGFPSEACAACDGSGYWSPGEYCEDCDGEGRISNLSTLYRWWDARYPTFPRTQDLWLWGLSFKWRSL